MLKDMLDEDYLRQNLKYMTKNDVAKTNEAAVAGTLFETLKAIAELHRKKPDIDLSSLRPAIDKLAGHANKAIQNEAKNLQAVIGE